MSARPRINVLHVMADQHQAAVMGCEGHPQAITPAMDRLARDGVRFTAAYTQNPICTPSRVSILSGQYCHNHGYFGLSGPRPDALPSFFSHFRAHGYRTAGIGNLHTPDDPRNWLEPHLDLYDDTFSSVDGKRGDDTAWYRDLRERGLYEIEDFRFGDVHPEFFMEGMPSKIDFPDSQEGWSVRSAIRFMEECGDRPFCMQVSLERPHQVFYPTRRFWDMYPEELDLPPTLEQDPSGRPPHFRAAFEAFRRYRSRIEPSDFLSVARRLWRGYLACITQVDYALGLLLEHLDRTGLADRTIVIYHADHGGYSGTHGIQEKAPGIPSEAVCRVPFIWRVPGNSARNGATSRELVESVDLAPTIASLCGLSPLESADGHDISGLLRGDGGAVREVAVTEHPWSKALRWRDWRFVHYQRRMFGAEDAGELYDLARDPTESRNLYHDAAHRGTVEECRRRLLEWLIDTTRVATVWPALDWSRRPYDYRTAGDGKEARSAGPAFRLKKGQLNYI